MGEEKERIALKLGYLGTRYHGFQIQPQAIGPTIEGELFDALQKLGIMRDRASSNYAAAGRTDKGVHALGQVVSFDTAYPNLTPRMINSLLPDDIWIIAIAKPPQGFHARRDAISRAYRYFLAVHPALELDITRMREAAELFIGAHDFSNFAQPSDQDRKEDVPGCHTTIREVKRLEVVSDKTRSFIIIDIEADGFLRKMVRKIVSALKLVGSGTKAKSWVEDLLELRITDQIEPVPAFGLLLKAVVYHGLEFVEDGYAKRRIAARIQENLRFHATMAEVLGTMVTDYAP
ncbi:MAG: tRNA pseudouridine(38-40) synthase TruA [Methanophagales archaeon ANME-1-THS]|nr:MAG: tRNA pseudouridine(38-40) synthase TruA [Methanophagales archaeon ANME-1-THS]